MVFIEGSVFLENGGRGGGGGGDGGIGVDDGDFVDAPGDFSISDVVWKYAGSWFGNLVGSFGFARLEDGVYVLDGADFVSCFHGGEVLGELVLSDGLIV